MSDYDYFPIVKTRDAELRCFRNLNPRSFEKVLPIYELTKSRITKKAPDGDIYRRMKQIEEIQAGRPFILDLCTDEKYINPQIEQLLSGAHGFRDWQYFIFDLHVNLNIIPMVHIFEDDDGVLPDVEEFVKEASCKVNNLAVRMPFDLDKENVEKYLEPIVNNLNPSCKLYVILDAGFVRDKEVSSLVDCFIGSCSGTVKYRECIEDVVILTTSFPSSPATEGGHDSSGKFLIIEEDVYEGVREEFDVKYGDYASINTEQIEMKGGTFVPRIDVASLDGRSFSYKRYRRQAGGYALCAKKTIEDTDNYTPLDIWADEEIALAAKDMPTGISPAFWISVRMNYYIETRLRLRGDSFS